MQRNGAFFNSDVATGTETGAAAQASFVPTEESAKPGDVFAHLDAATASQLRLLFFFLFFLCLGVVCVSISRLLGKLYHDQYRYFEDRFDQQQQHKDHDNVVVVNSDGSDRESGPKDEDQRRR